MKEQTHPTETLKSPKIEATDIMYGAGLIFIFAGLGIAIGWGCALAATGVILLLTSLWLVSPFPQKWGGD